MNAGKNSKKSPIKSFFGLVVLFFDNLAGIQYQIREKVIVRSPTLINQKRKWEVAFEQWKQEQQRRQSLHELQAEQEAIRTLRNGKRFGHNY